MLCGVFAEHFISFSFLVVVVVSVPVEKELHILHILHIDVVADENEQGWPPAPEASSALIQMI